MIPFRYIPLETHDAAMNMALDEACMESVRDGAVPPTIRLYRWSPSSISIGNYQCYADEVDQAAVKKSGITVTRRLTGGGAVYHDADGEVTYSMILPEEFSPRDLSESYRILCEPLLRALTALGLSPYMRGVNDIIVGDKKVSGNAQTRRQGVTLQHGTLLFTVDAEKMFTFLTPDKSKLSDKPFIASVNSAVTSLSELGITDRAQAEKIVRESFRTVYPGSEGEWTTRELYRAEELARTKYGTEEWVKQR